MPAEEKKVITVSGLQVEVVRKGIKNLHLGVYPPDGRVRVAAPLAVDNEAVRMAVVTRLAWIRRQQSKFKQQPRQSTRQMVTGESHYVLGQRLRLRVEEQPGRQGVCLRGKTRLLLTVRPGVSVDVKRRLLDEWYRSELKTLAAQWQQDWEKRLGVKMAALGVRRMKTRWGSCNPATGRILLNLELAKTPVQYIEYVFVHELAHLRERQHDAKFIRLLDQHLPTWREAKNLLGQHPLGV